MTGHRREAVIASLLGRQPRYLWYRLMRGRAPTLFSTSRPLDLKIEQSQVRRSRQGYRCGNNFGSL